MQSTAEAGNVIGIGAMITLFVVTLGPIKILGPFAQATKDFDPATVRQVAVRAFLVSLAALLISAVAGMTLLDKWHISVPALELAGGLIFLLVGLRIVLEQYQPVHHAPEPLPDSPSVAGIKLSFPTIVTPYGIAAVMVLLARSTDASRTWTIVALLVAVMLLNLVAMLTAHSVMRGPTLLIMRIVGAVLGVLQVALAVEMILVSLRTLGVLHD